MRLALRSMTLLLATILCASLIACDDDDDDTGPLPAGDIWPLAVGNTWTYTESGQSINHAVSGTEIIGGVEVYRLEFSANLHLLLKTHSDGVYAYGETGEVYDQPGLILRYPTHDGDTWEDFQGSTVRVSSTSAAVTVPAGQFTCVEYVFNEIGHMFYSPGVGMIKTTATFDDVTTTMELTAYELY